MSIYEEMYANVDMIFSDQCYHRGLGKGLLLFSNQDEFFDLLDDIVFDVISKEQDLKARSIEAYAAKLLSHWSGIAFPDKHTVVIQNTQMTDLKEYSDELKEFRGNYRKSGLLDAVRSFYRFIRRRL